MYPLKGATMFSRARILSYASTIALLLGAYVVAPAQAQSAATVNAQTSTTSQNIKQNFWIKDFKPVLDVAKYGKTEVEAYNSDNKKLDDINNQNAVSYRGKVTIDIPVNKMLEKLKIDQEWNNHKPFESIKERSKGPIFNYVLSLPDITTPIPSSDPNTQTAKPDSLTWESATATSTTNLIDSTSISTHINGNKIAFCANINKDLTWQNILQSTTLGNLTLTANYSITKEQYDYLKKNNKSTHIIGSGEFSGAWLDEDEKNKNLTDSHLNQYIFYYYTDQMAHSLITGSKEAIKYNQLTKNLDLHTARKFNASGKVSPVKYSDYTDPAIDKDGYEIHTILDNNSFKEALIPLEHWLSVAKNNVDGINISDFKSSALITFTLPDALEISPIFKQENGERYQEKGDPTNPTKIVQKNINALPEFSLEYVKQEGKTLQIRVNLLTHRLHRFGGNQLLSSPYITYKQLKQYVQNLSKELEIQFVALKLDNKFGKHGEKYNIKGNIDVTTTGNVIDNGNLVPFKITYGVDNNPTDLSLEVEIPYDVKFKFKSGTPGKEIPKYISDKYLVQMHGYLLKVCHVYKGKTYTLTSDQLNFSPDEEDDELGTWTFNKSLGWEYNGKTNTKSIENVNNDIELVGTWNFTPYKSNNNDNNNDNTENTPDNGVNDSDDNGIGAADEANNPYYIGNLNSIINTQKLYSYKLTPWNYLNLNNSSSKDYDSDQNDSSKNSNRKSNTKLAQTGSGIAYSACSCITFLTLAFAANVKKRRLRAKHVK